MIDENFKIMKYRSLFPRYALGRINEIRSYALFYLYIIVDHSLSTCVCRPAVCLVVSGPGLLHALGGMANAMINCW